MLIYTLVTDRYEDSEYDDSAWLDVALHVHGQLDGPGEGGAGVDRARLRLAGRPSSAFRGQRNGAFSRPSATHLSRQIWEMVLNSPSRGRLDSIRSLVTAAVALHEGYAAV